MPQTQEDVDDPSLDKTEAGDDDVEFQVDLDPDDPDYVPPHIPQDDDEEYNQNATTQAEEETTQNTSVQPPHRDLQNGRKMSRQENDTNDFGFQNANQNNPMMNTPLFQQMQQMQNMMGFPNMMSKSRLLVMSNTGTV